MRTDTQRLARLTNLNKQVIGFTTNTHIAGIQSLQTNDVQLVGCEVVIGVVADGVLPRTLSVNISIRALATLQRIITSTSIEGIVARATVQGIVAETTEQGVSTVLTVERIAAFTTTEQIIASTTIEYIVTLKPCQLIGSGITDNTVAAFRAYQKRRSDFGLVPDSTVSKLQLIDCITIRLINCEM